MIYEMTRSLADNELTATAGHYDKNHEFPRDHAETLKSLGLYGISMSEEYDGAGLDHLAYAIAMEEVSRGDASVGVLMSVMNSLYGGPLNYFASEDLKQKYLKPYAR